MRGVSRVRLTPLPKERRSCPLGSDTSPLVDSASHVRQAIFNGGKR